MKNYLYPLLIGFLLACNSKKDPEDYVISTYYGEVEEKIERQYQDSLQLIHQYIIDCYSDIMLSEGPNLFFVDYQTNNIVKYRIDGSKLGNYLRGMGDGPQELLQPVFVGIEDDHFLIFDRGLQSIKEFSGLDNFIFRDSYKAPRPWVKGAYFKDSDFVLTRANSNSQLDFDFFSIKSMEVNSLDTLSSLFYPVEDADMVYDGFLRATDTDIFYFMYSNSKFVKFNKEGIEYVGEIIQTIPSPNLVRDGNSTFLNESVSGIFDAAVTDQYLYILSGIIYPSIDNGLLSIDIYEAVNGKYLKSVMLPSVPGYPDVYPQHIVVTEKNLVVLYEESIVSVFELP